MLLHDDILNELEIYRAFAAVIPGYDPYGETQVDIPVRRSRSSGRMETACPELETAANHFYSLSVLSNP